MNSVPRLHLISNRAICPLDQFPGVAESATRGGVDAIHLREPDLDVEDLRPFARELRERLHGTGARLLINRHIELACEIGAGVHLAEEQFERISEARAALSDAALVGISIHDVETALRAQDAGVDYVIAGHVFETGSKPGQAGRGLDFVTGVAAAISIPVIAIGGITPENTADVRRAGAHGVAVLSGILASDSPERMAAAYRTALECDEEQSLEG